MNPTLPILFLLFFLSVGHSYPHPASAPSWTPLANIALFPRQEHTTVFLPPSTITILGGIIPGSANSSITTDIVQSYSIPNDTWKSNTPIPLPLNHLNAAVCEGKIYVLGGLAEPMKGVLTWPGVANSWMYDPHLDKWTDIPGLPRGEERGSAAVGVYKDKIYLAGGLSFVDLVETGEQRTVSIVSIYDTAKQQWLEVPSAAKTIPEGRDHAGAAVVGSKMYILGGRDRETKNVKDTVFILDLDDLEMGWGISQTKMPTPRGGIAAGVIGGEVYAFGGEGNAAVESGIFDQVEAYDTVKDEWRSVGRMDIPRHGTYAVGVGKNIYIPGGATVQGGGPVAHFDKFSP
ncbi:galactose oxidase [Corynespora cassiicola Philippines]|uniref:Galactose oxidase n=1 Tax=Corynespora cassiicola Philippines TaxID=1448308 RepID=A0A2T2N7A2_CORCC|nr:galactose oxidase [Corynespora cassiicola Philippines]